jgi:hypothetical protein
MVVLSNSCPLLESTYVVVAEGETGCFPDVDTVPIPEI